MDLKRAWRNGFLISVVFALPLSDLYNSQQSNLIAIGASDRKPVQQAKNCADTDCGLENGISGNDAIETEDNGLMIPAESRSGLMLESSGNQSGNVWNTALHFSPQDILHSDLTGGENQEVDDDVQQLIDIDLSSMASLSYDPVGSSFFLPGHSGSFSPAGFNGGSSGAGSGSLNALSDAGETSSSNEFSESSTQTETEVPNSGDTLQNVPEPSSLVLMTIGTISVAALLRLRKPKTPTSHA